MIRTLDPSINIISRKALMRKIAEMAENDQNDTKAMLQDAKYVET